MAGIPLVRRLSEFLLGDASLRLQRMIFHEATRAFSLAQPEFPGRLHLPSEYGKRLPERVVELALARTTYTPGARVLDVGHSNIMECHRRFLKTLPLPRHLTGVDIASPVYDTGAYYEQSITADITATGLPAAAFDIIWCVSTLEHVGMDNSVYTENFVRRPGMDAAALDEMIRLLAPGGMLLVTVPFGLYEDHGWFKNYDRASWGDLLSGVRTKVDISELYFGYDPHRGWEAVAPSSLSSRGYHTYPNAGAAGLAAALIGTPLQTAGRERRL
jgi:O-antigen chain-terminating methyltransferase